MESKVKTKSTAAERKSGEKRKNLFHPFIFSPLLCFLRGGLCSLT
ncbi:hypothetical protein HMPREF7215_2076 [Pyramidobacter piscolens W5455]|uniref:Uncharacterized protein n=1 Tax=Pyramidobacter piscolens W5455 TaxID=352165 RepID=A0ABM9ZU23_9BACT|nr:hypothetical protein HMPREF7215_2076 [Pyramidobacter piscolens W5455]